MYLILDRVRHHTDMDMDTDMWYVLGVVPSKYKKNKASIMSIYHGTHKYLSHIRRYLIAKSQE